MFPQIHFGPVQRNSDLRSKGRKKGESRRKKGKEEEKGGMGKRGSREH